MKCVICKAGETEIGVATVTLERAGATLVIKDVPAEVCNNCGEEYISEITNAQLLEFAEKAVSNGVEVDIRRFAVPSLAMQPL